MAIHDGSNFPGYFLLLSLPAFKSVPRNGRGFNGDSPAYSVLLLWILVAIG